MLLGMVLLQIEWPRILPITKDYMEAHIKAFILGMMYVAHMEAVKKSLVKGPYGKSLKWSKYSLLNRFLLSCDGLNWSWNNSSQLERNV